MKRTLSLAIGLILLLSPLPASAAAPNVPKDRGLLITPLRVFPSLSAGSQKTSSFTVANLTDGVMQIQFSVKQFSVADYTYDYQFSDPNNNWVKLGLASIALQPHKSQDVPYTVAVPAGSAPGGHYYTLFASANTSSGGLTSTIQATTLLYVTVQGQLVKTGLLRSSSIQRLTFGKQVNYTIEPVNTGNVYYFVYMTGQLHGLFANVSSPPSTHLLMPGKVRSLSGSIAVPILPGIYRATYGYKSDSGMVVTKSRYIVSIPPWSIATLLGLCLLGDVWYRRRKQSKQPSKPSDTPTDS